MICLICSGFRIGVVSEDVASPCSAVVPIVFRCVLPRSSVSSDPLGDGGSGLVGLGALSSVKALSSPSPSDEKIQIFCWGVDVVCVVGLRFVCLLSAAGGGNQMLQSSPLRAILAAGNR